VSIRLSSIQTLNTLFKIYKDKKEKEVDLNITYLNENDILQCFYKLLKDKDPELQSVNTNYFIMISLRYN